MRGAGDRIDRYEIESLLGAGGMGEVYVAVDGRLGRRVALKLLAPSSGASEASEKDAAARLLREARAAAALDHPNAVSVFDVGEVDGVPYIAMELVSGVTLRSHVAKSEPGWQTRLRWLTDAARALHAAHKRNLVHRDVKPDNVMVRDDGVVKVLDFGIARRTPGLVDPSAPTQSPNLPTLTTKGDILGTPRYMAPEQIKDAPIDGRTDQFAWGVMAYELFTGRVPWSGGDNALALTASIIGDAPAPLGERAPDLPAEVVAAIHRTLSKAPGDRFETMDELVGILEVHAGPAGGERPPRPAATAATGAVVAMTAGSGFSSLGGTGPRGRLLVLGLVALGVAGGGAIVLAGRPARVEQPPPSASSREAIAEAPTAVASAPAPSGSAAAGPRGPLRSTCTELRPAPDIKACREDHVAWCDPAGTRIACCKTGLAATGSDGICACPPGGANDEADPSCPRPTQPRDEAIQAVQGVVRGRFGEIRACYEEVLKRAPKAAGGISFHFTLTPDGDVFNASIEEASLPDADAQLCALKIFRSLRFAPARGGVTAITYPIVFSPGG